MKKRMRVLLSFILLVFIISSHFQAANRFYIIAQEPVTYETKVRINDLFASVEEHTGVKLFIMYLHEADYDLDEMAENMLNDIFADTEMQIVVYYAELQNALGFAQSLSLEESVFGEEQRKNIELSCLVDSLEANERVILLSNMLTQLIYEAENDYEVSEIINEALNAKVGSDTNSPYYVIISGVLLVLSLTITFFWRKRRGYRI